MRRETSARAEPPMLSHRLLVNGLRRSTAKNALYTRVVGWQSRIASLTRNLPFCQRSCRVSAKCRARSGSRPNATQSSCRSLTASESRAGTKLRTVESQMPRCRTSRSKLLRRASMVM